MKRVLVATTLIGALWSILVPYAGHALGLNVDVAPEIEIVDHVVPGVLGAVAALVALGLIRRREDGTTLYLAAVGVLVISALWMAATHVSLVGQALDGFVPWGSTLWHALPGFVQLALGVVLLTTFRGSDPRQPP